MFGFLFWLFFVGIIVASLQDLKRREVDNWLNLFLIMSSVVYLLFMFSSMENYVGSILLVILAALTSFLYFYNGEIFSSIEKSKKKYYFWLSLISVLFIFAVFKIVKVYGINEVPVLVTASCLFLIMFVVSNLFYEGRVFAGGDAKLLFAMTVFFIGITFMATLVNIGIFLLFLMFAGSIYGIIYSVVLYIKDFEKVNKKIKEGFSSLLVRCLIVFGVILFAFSYVNLWFLFFAIFTLVLPLLYVFAKGLENVSMMRTISGKELREGDWLVDDVKVRVTSNSSHVFLTEFEKKVKGKVIKADWDGLSLEDIKLLKTKKKVKIKEGLPFVPAFLIAFILYVFLKEWFVELLIALA